MLAIKGNPMLAKYLRLFVKKLGYSNYYNMDNTNLCYILVSDYESNFITAEEVDLYDGEIITAEEFLEL